MDAKRQLDLIARLAEDARGSLNDMAVPFLLFGCATVIGTIFSYALAGFGYTKSIFILWSVLMAIPNIVMAVGQTKGRVPSATDKIFSVLWGSIGFAIVVIMLSCFSVLHSKTSFSSTFLVIALLLFVGYEVSGMLIRSKLMMILGLFWLVAGIACVFVPPLIAPAVIGIATFLLEVVPAIGILLKKKKA